MNYVAQEARGRYVVTPNKRMQRDLRKRASPARSAPDAQRYRAWAPIGASRSCIKNIFGWCAVVRRATLQTVRSFDPPARARRAGGVKDISMRNVNQLEPGARAGLIVTRITPDTFV